MSFKEINELRKAGKFSEAHNMAVSALENEPDNIWNRRAYAWVIYEFIKANTDSDKLTSFFEWLDKAKNLNPKIDSDAYRSESEFLSLSASPSLPHSDTMVFDSIAFQIGKVARELSLQNQSGNRSLLHLFNIIKQFNFSKPSDGYSFILKSFLKGLKETAHFKEFADWWGFANLRPEDFKPEVFQGREIMALAEQLYIAYSKALLKGEQSEHNGFVMHNIINIGHIESFLPDLDKIISNHPDYTYPLYFKAKLLLAIGKRDEAVQEYLPFARHKQNDFWVWELLAELQADDNNKLACYCKALTCTSPPKFLVAIKEKLSALLIKMGMLVEASIEIYDTIRVKQENQYRISQTLHNWTAQEWYRQPVEQQTNRILYFKHKTIAEELLFADIPIETIAIEFVNTTKKMANFVKNKTFSGFFKYDNHFKSLAIGDVLNVRLKHVNDNFYQLLTATKLPAGSSCEAIKSFNAPIEMKQGNTFGFADRVFIHPDTISRHKIANNQTISGNAILSFNKSKNEWGWKAFVIN